MTTSIETSREAQFPDNLPPGWRARLAPEKDKDYFKRLVNFLNSERRANAKVYPDSSQILRALQKLDFDDVRVVILGQDPYHGAGQAIGLSFAVPSSLKPKPPSLVNIFKEIASDLKVEVDVSKSELSGWVAQGVLLLNTVLTVRAGEAFSHRDKGWETFTDKVISELGARKTPLVFILWGAAAQKKKALIVNKEHLILESPHPSPLSSHRGFFGSKPFSKSNDWLKHRRQEPIDWTRSES
ncbi:MAG: uracil-DNA glycosylase [Bdellovibrionota bacterium]